MNFETKRYINKLTQVIIDEYKIELPITNIDAVVKKLGGKVVRVDVLDILWDDQVCKTGQNSFAIKLNEEREEKQDRYSALIALGHLFLHMGFRTDKEVWKRQQLNKYRRFSAIAADQATVFANAFLMPEKAFISMVDENTNEKNIVNLDPIAKKFDVSIGSVIKRGRFLGIFDD